MDINREYSISELLHIKGEIEKNGSRVLMTNEGLCIIGDFKLIDLKYHDCIIKIMGDLILPLYHTNTDDIENILSKTNYLFPKLRYVEGKLSFLNHEKNKFFKDFTNYFLNLEYVGILNISYFKYDSKYLRNLKYILERLECGNKIQHEDFLSNVVKIGRLSVKAKQHKNFLRNVKEIDWFISGGCQHKDFLPSLIFVNSLNICHNNHHNDYLKNLMFCGYLVTKDYVMDNKFLSNLSFYGCKYVNINQNSDYLSHVNNNMFDNKTSLLYKDAELKRIYNHRIIYGNIIVENYVRVGGFRNMYSVRCGNFYGYGRSIRDALNNMSGINCAYNIKDKSKFTNDEIINMFICDYGLKFIDIRDYFDINKEENDIEDVLSYAIQFNIYDKVRMRFPIGDSVLDKLYEIALRI